MILIDPSRQQKAMERALSGVLGGVRWKMKDDAMQGEPAIKKIDLGDADSLTAIARKHTKSAAELPPVPGAVLDETQVRTMRILVKRGMSARQAWKQVAPNVSHTTAFRAIHGDTWRDLIVIDDVPASATILKVIDL